MTRLIVERADRISNRPWLFITGRLEGESVHIGDQLTVVFSQALPITAIVRAIEFHGHEGLTTVAIDDDRGGRYGR